MTKDKFLERSVKEGVLEILPDGTKRLNVSKFVRTDYGFKKLKKLIGSVSIINEMEEPLTGKQELKPCPICKGKVECKFIPEENFGEWDHYRISCFKENDHVVSVIRMTESEAFEAWNSQTNIAIPITENPADNSQNIEHK